MEGQPVSVCIESIWTCPYVMDGVRRSRKYSQSAKKRIMNRESEHGHAACKQDADCYALLLVRRKILADGRTTDTGSIIEIKP